jgi:hypothetical protein
MYYLVLTLMDWYILHGQNSDVLIMKKQRCLHISYVSIISINLFLLEYQTNLSSCYKLQKT